MKTNSIFLLLLLSFLTLTSCEDYDDYNEDRPTVVGFVGSETSDSSDPSSLAPGESAEITAFLFASDLSTSQRSFAIELDSAENELTEDNVSFDTQVVFPANERNAEITVTITNNSLTTTPELLVLKLVTDPSYVVGERLRVSASSAE
ncbi:hypothetical protein [Psychroflexus tropicus]|uniref:hypothetical protein n=1 Tax=Psychroflexus tropicus TaxID=197345 RepID=UPI00036463A0|nr:hypothetical protein [Psychroflexus tropicus]